MFVRANKSGFYGGTRHEAGDEFQLAAGDKAGSWMTPIDAPTKPIKNPDGPKQEVDRLKDQVKTLESDLSSANAALDEQLQANEQLSVDLELERMRLAAVDAYAADKGADMLPEYRSAALDGVSALHARIAKLQEPLTGTAPDKPKPPAKPKAGGASPPPADASAAAT